MHKRFLFPVVLSAILAAATMSAAEAGSSVAYSEKAHTAPDRDYVIQPGTDPATVQLHFAGAQRVSFSGTGALEIVNQDGHAWRYRPEVYQVVNGKRKLLSVGFSFMGPDRVALRLSKYDPSAPLIVTPVSGVAVGM
jgi:hypothetical protein